MKPIVLKIGGHDINDYDFLGQLPRVLQTLPNPIIIVHGGGVEITDLQRRLGITPRYVDGVRITDTASLAVVTQILRGVVNTRLVSQLILGGLDAVGLSGVDRGMIRAVQMQVEGEEDMGFTGVPTQIRVDVLQSYLDAKIIPVIAPVCLGEDGEIYNVNADHVAGAVAGAIQPEQVVFLTNVEGVLNEGKLIPTMTPLQAEQLIEEEIIFGGMIPKVRTALELLNYGVSRVVITNLTGLANGSGTTLVPNA